ncbi:MAG: hydroxymyristoyl-ACP dehydratase [Legionella sp.]|nr:hydroxymyristoyl-ACP dehydratase [Legionella sp.]
MRFLFVDQILQLSPGTYIKGVKHITADDFYLTRNDSGKACFIPSLMGEVLGQLAAWNVMQQNDFTLRPVAGVVASARMFRPAYLGETLLLESFIDALDETAVEYHSVASIGKEIVFTIEGALGPLLPMTDFIEVDAVKRQFSKVYRLSDKVENFEEIAELKSLSLLSNSPNDYTMSFDRILASEPAVSMVAEKRLTGAAPYFPDHFPNKPVLPLTVLLECKLNLAKVFIQCAGFTNDYTFSECRKIKMNGFVEPGDCLISYVKVKQQDDNQLILSYRSEVEGKRVCVVDLVFHSQRFLTDEK